MRCQLVHITSELSMSFMSYEIRDKLRNEYQHWNSSFIIVTLAITNVFRFSTIGPINVVDTKVVNITIVLCFIVFY